MSQSPAQTTLIGKYRLLRELGEGAFGCVWAAIDTEDGSQVAVKLVHHDRIRDSETTHLLREARSAGQVSHPNIVRVREVGKAGDQHFIVSDLVDGISLSAWLKRYNRCDIEQAARWSAVLGHALQHAHDAGIVHRDLKPANIMVDVKNELHIMDFGLAKQETDEVTTAIERYQRARYLLRHRHADKHSSSGPLLGTPAYMPPEQAWGDGYFADPRSDVYSLGVILYELLTGRRPFIGRPRQLIRMIRYYEPKPPRLINRRVPKPLQAVCLKAMSKRHDDRYESAQAFAEDCERFLQKKKVTAPVFSRLRLRYRWLASRLGTPIRSS